MYNEEGFNRLANIPPHQLSKSHFTSRAQPNVLVNNMCEVLNPKLLKGVINQSSHAWNL
ncbi:hypothetical protein HanIR_Chr06g0260541 [Helianthus annuus]|nr:hypothetical protein HanIR_Chr06g0260541 [Helianthus annuus]